MSFSFSGPELFWPMVYSSWEGSRTGDPCIDPALLCVPTVDQIIETTVARVQTPVGSQPQLSESTYKASSRPHETGPGGHVTIQRTHRQDRGSRNINRNVRAVCTDCNKSFGRPQELARHKKDVHERPRKCLFCGFKWTRPSNIKAHLFAKHSEKTEHLVTIHALRGRMIVAFLDGYDQRARRGAGHQENGQ